MLKGVNRDGMEKYLFKYFIKGFDCARMGLQRRRCAESATQGINKICD